MAQKYFKANEKKLESLRVARGWSREQFAAKAIVSTRTLDSIMAGKQAVLSTFSKLAKALETPVHTIVDGFEEPQPRGERRYTVTITISAPYDEFDETKDLPEWLTRILSRVGGDELWGAEAGVGSTQIRFLLTDAQHDKFISEMEAGNLNDLNDLGIFVSMKILWEPYISSKPRTLQDDLYPEGELRLETSEPDSDRKDEG